MRCWFWHAGFEFHRWSDVTGGSWWGESVLVNGHITQQDLAGYACWLLTCINSLAHPYQVYSLRESTYLAYTVGWAAGKASSLRCLHCYLSEMKRKWHSPRDSWVLFNREGPKGLLIFLDTLICVVHGMRSLSCHLYSVFCLFQSFRW